MSTVTIRDVQVIATQPAGARLVIVKVITSEPGLHGVGCATFTQRFRAVIAAVERHLKPLLIGRDVDRIEEIYQLSCVNGYWRNGPVLNNAISGVDQAVGHQGQARGHTDKKRSARLVEVLGRAALAASNPGRFRAS